MYSNPLNNIKIASLCPANWDEMYGDERKRYCSECKLNVYNLSEMTRAEAGNFLINTEGRVCVKFYRRRDGTVLTQDCPVGLKMFKKRIAQTTKAVFASIFGLLSGLFIFNQNQININSSKNQVVVESDSKNDSLEPVVGEVENTTGRKRKKMSKNEMVLGRVESVRRL